MRGWLVMGSILAVAGSGCGSAGSTFTGSVDSNLLTVRDAVFDRVEIDNGSGGTGTALYIILADGTGLCDSLRSRSAGKSVTLFELELVSQDSTLTLQAPPTGTYPVAPALSFAVGNQAEALFVRHDSACNNTLGAGVGSATSGTVTLERYMASAGGTLGGSFDVKFSGSDAGKGTLEATFCELPTAGGSACPP